LQILKIIEEQRKLEKESKLSGFDPKHMIFVCNKWDVVIKRGESEQTWQDIVRKLKMTIPELNEDHIFKMSVTEVGVLIFFCILKYISFKLISP
jgi:predicted GTPase